MEINKKFWKNKNVLITGHNGFKGSWLSIILKMVGANVYGISLKPSTNNSIYKLTNLKYLIDEDKILDIRNFKNLLQYIKKKEPDIIFHMAAQSIVRNSYLTPIDTYSTNIMGTINLLEAVKSVTKTKCIINVTSDKCYQNNETTEGLKEIDMMGGNDPYSSSKGCVELISQAYRKSFFDNTNISLPSVRAGNVIGGGDNNNYRLIPDIFRSLDTNMPLEIRSLHSVRPWQHILDLLCGYIKIAELAFFSTKYSSGWNFGPNKNNHMTVEEILNYFIDFFPELKWKIRKKLLFNESKLLHLDISKSKNKLNWEPKINIKEALKLTIEWYIASKKNVDMRKFTHEQICDHFQI